MDTISTVDVFKLHSLPTSSFKVYLDFDGHVTTGSVWNNYWSTPTITSPTYNLGSDSTASFSDAEKNQMIDIWQRVSEYFSPFNIDVTTEDPGADGLNYSGTGDTAFGKRVVITDEGGKNYGGIAYTGSFDWVGAEAPVFVYANRLGDATKAIADAAAHEVGHSLGLKHDGQTGTPPKEYYYGHGSGVTDWAPVVGVGYQANIVQWSKGEYYLASNTQDDLAIITSQNSGVNYRADDHGSTFATATVLSFVADGATAVINTTYGVIERSGSSNDLDIFKFELGAGGDVAITVGAGSRGYITGGSGPLLLTADNTMLDVGLRLFDSTYTLVGTANSTATLDATMALNDLAGGVYYLEVDGVGWGSPTSSTPTGYTEYGSLGQYYVRGTFTVATGTSSNPPVASNGASSTNEDTTLSGDVLSLVIDPESDALTYSQVGTLSGLTFNSNGTFSYVPAANVNGPVTFQFRANDGTSNSNTATYTINVVAVNDAPTDIALSAATVVENAEPGAIVGTLSVTDIDGGAATYSILTSGVPFAINGSDIIVNGELDYETQTSWTFDVQANDGAGGTRTESFTVSVTDFDESGGGGGDPTLVVDTVSLNMTEGQVATITLTLENATGEEVISLTGLNSSVASLSASSVTLNSANSYTASFTVTGLENRNDVTTNATNFTLAVVMDSVTVDTVSVTVNDDDYGTGILGARGPGTWSTAIGLSNLTQAAIRGDESGTTSRTLITEGTRTDTGQAEMDVQWKFTSATIGGIGAHKVQIDASSSTSEAFKFQYSVDAKATWSDLSGGPGFSTTWNGDYDLTTTTTADLWLRIIDQGGTDATRSTVDLDLLTVTLPEYLTQVWA